MTKAAALQLIQSFGFVGRVRNDKLEINGKFVCVVYRGYVNAAQVKNALN